MNARTEPPPVRREGRCRGKPRPLPVDEPRPTDVIGAFFLFGLAMLVAGAGAAIVNAIDPWAWGRWLALHLLFVGGVSQLVLGASQFFAGAFLATDPPRRALIRAQLLGWNVGTVLIVVSVPSGIDAALWAGAGCLLAVLAIYSWAFVQMRRRSLGTAPWATRWYLTAALLLALGTALGAVLAHGISWSQGNLLAAHMTLNLGGWFGTAIIGTLHTFFPSLTRSRLRFPRLQGPTFTAWIVGVAAVAGGYAFTWDAVALVGWGALAVAAAALAANIMGCLFAAPRPLSLPARIVAAAQLFAVAGVAVAGAAAVGSGPEQALTGSTRAAVGTLLVAGWIGLTVLGSLLHLLALLIRVRDLARGMPVPSPARDSVLTVAAVVGVATVAAAQLAGGTPLEPAARVLLFAAYLILGARVAILGVRVLATARPRL
jgi:nitrite reductase (NO-forming)